MKNKRKKFKKIMSDAKILAMGSGLVFIVYFTGFKFGMIPLKYEMELPITAKSIRYIFADGTIEKI